MLIDRIIQKQELQIPQLKQWITTTDIALIVTSGITYADLDPESK